MKLRVLLLTSVMALSSLASPIRDASAAKSLNQDTDYSKIVPVEYLESSLGQYINTGIVGGDGTHCEIIVRRTTLRSNECFLGAVESGNTHRLWLCYTFGGKWYPGYNNTASYTASSNDFEWHHIETFVSSGRFGYRIDGEPFLLPFKFSPGFICSNPLLLFAMGTDSGAAYFAVGQIARCRIFKSDELVADFQPVRMRNEGYMLDTVTGTLFANQGTGSFIIGPDL